MASHPRRPVDAASRGDAAAVEALIVRHLPALRRFVERSAGAIVREKESCSDLVQTVCREALENVGQYRYWDENGFRQWLYSAALHKIQARARYYRAGKRDAVRERPLPYDAGTTSGGHDVPRDEKTPSRKAAAREDLARLNEAFDRLPDQYREVIVLSRQQGLPHAEIARRLSRSEPAVRVLLSRALARLVTLASEE